MKFLESAPRLQLAAVVLGAALLYGTGLSHSPIHLHYDEAYFAAQAQAVAETGRDVRGRLFPVYFQMDNVVWFQPLGVYMPALAFQFLPISIASLRLPTALIGALDVLLLYFLARRVLKHHGFALLAAGLLALAPAHFIHSRMAVDYLFPTPFALAWSILLLRFIDTRSLPVLFAAGSVLGIGIYSYIASLALLPLLLSVTVMLLWLERMPLRTYATVVAGFCWPLIPAVLFLSAYPTVFGNTFGRYGITAGQLDAFQQIRETLTPWFISDRLNLYMTFFGPGYLFVSGSSGLVGSTRNVGIFLAPTLPLMLIGLREALLKYSPAAVIVVAGVFLPPVAASVVAEPFAAGRAMTMIPFALLLAAWGAAVLFDAKPLPGLTSLIAAAGAAALVLAGAYLAYRLRGGDISPGALGLFVVGVAILAIAYVVHRQQRMAGITIALLIVCVLQFGVFAQEYFGPYRARSAAWFNGNIREAVVQTVADLNRRADQPPVYLSSGITRIEWYWLFHVAELGRRDLSTRARPVSDPELEGLELAPGAIYLCLAVDAHARSVAEGRNMTLFATITDPNDEDMGPGDHPVYVLYRAP
jgi:4-amino-4-deoxy-L-arabinose transferase-like glycosyltransferase